MPLPIQNFGHILTDLVDAVLVGDELALDVLRLQRAAQQGGIRQIELTGCRIAAGTPLSVDLLRSLLIHTQLFFTFPYYFMQTDFLWDTAGSWAGCRQCPQCRGT